MTRAMGLRRCLLFLALALILALAVAPGVFAKAKGVKADTVLINGKIITVDANDSIARAVAIKDGRIIAVGTRNQIRPYMNARTVVIDLHGRTATPGMIDTHGHFNGADLLYSLDLSVLQVSSIEDVKAKIAAQCDLVGPGEWVQGSKWAAVHLAEHRPIYASDLDPVSPDNPVFLLETSYHQATANSYALELAGIDASTPDPPGGLIDRDADGNPTGLLKESAVWWVAAMIPPYTQEQVTEGTRFFGPFANSVGVTSILYAGPSDAVWDAFSEVNADGDLSVRTGMLWSSPDTLEDSEAVIDEVGPRIHPYDKDDDMLWVQGIKMFLDGAQDAGTHWSWEEQFTDFTTPNPGWYGMPTMDPDLYRAQVKLYHDAGLHVQTHAIGDRAIDWALGSYLAAEEANPIYGLRHAIIHCDIPTDEALQTLVDLQRDYDAGFVQTSPDFMWWTEVIASTMGPELSLREMPYRTYENLGISYSFGTDWSVDPLDPKYNIWSAITRDTLIGLYGEHPFGLDECIDVHEAMRAATRSGAHLLFMEDDIGSVEVGKYADIAIWDKDWYKATTDEIFDMNCEMTLVGGETVYMADETPITVSRLGKGALR